jgi:hypothetical protein
LFAKQKFRRGGVKWRRPRLNNESPQQQQQQQQRGELFAALKNAGVDELAFSFVWMEAKP